MRVLLLMILAVFSLSVSAQTITATGNVKDATGDPIIGASIVEKGNTSNGTITNLNGDFSLKVPANATLIVSYIGMKTQEIAIKGKNRYLFEDALVSQMNHALKKVDGTFRIRKEQGRIYIEMDGEYDYDEAVEALKCVFGIVGICPVVILEDEGFDKLAEEVIHHIDEAYPDKHFTFKVNARRARKNYPLESMEINAAMGEKILDFVERTNRSGK